MPAKITKEVRERIYDLNKDGKSVKEIDTWDTGDRGD